jgi:hypothetical protein
MRTLTSPRKTVTFTLTEDTFQALQPIAERLWKERVPGLIDENGQVNRSALIRYLITREMKEIKK